MDKDDQCTVFGHRQLASAGAGIKSDILRFATSHPLYRPELTFKTYLSIFLKPSILCLAIYRVAHCLYVRKWFRLARCLTYVNVIVHKAYITAQSCIGPGCFIGHSPATYFHGRAGRNLTLFSLAIVCPHEDSIDGPAEHGPLLGDNVTVAAHAAVFGPVRVGDNTNVAPRTQVQANCPANAIATSGAPPRFKPLSDA